MTLQVRRDGELRTLRATPVYDAAEKRPLLGFTFGGTEYPAGPVRAAGLSVTTMWEVTSATVTTIAGIFEAEKRKEISGVVGSYETTRQSIEVSTTQALFLLALISLSLGVINLFPFLPLDGGHIFWALAEKVRGRAIPFSVMERAGLRGLRARDGAVRDRLHERHRPTDGRGLQRALTHRMSVRLAGVHPAM